jgi:predicted DNA binding CopG/RHH family protein
MKTQKIPEIDSIEELAQFWDTHDLTDFEDQVEEVRESVFQRRPDTVIMVRLQRQEIEALKRSAKARGVREAALLRQWVREKVRERKS